MELNIIWSRWEDDIYEIAAAWDEYSVDANYEGWLEEVKQQREKARDNNCDIRIQKIRIPFKSVESLFEIPSVDAEIVE
jgi:hypothetical protein